MTVIPWLSPTSWDAGVFYTADIPSSTVFYQDSVYVCVYSHYSSSSFEPAYWQVILTSGYANTATAASLEAHGYMVQAGESALEAEGYLQAIQSIRSEIYLQIDESDFSQGVFSSTAAGLSNGVDGVVLGSPGSGGTNGTYNLAFSGGGGSQAVGRFVVVGGVVTSISMTYPGIGYTSAPTVSFSACPGLVGAVATASIAPRNPIGTYFSVPDTGDFSLRLYRVDSGPVAVEVARYPSLTIVGIAMGCATISATLVSTTWTVSATTIRGRISDTNLDVTDFSNISLAASQALVVVTSDSNPRSASVVSIDATLLGQLAAGTRILLLGNRAGTLFGPLADRAYAASGDALKAPLVSPSLTGTPTAPTAPPGTNTTQISTTAFVRAEIASLVDSAPGTLDTLNELAAALGDDSSFATNVTSALLLKASQADLDIAEASIATLESNVSTLESNVSTLESNVSTLESNVEGRRLAFRSPGYGSPMTLSATVDPGGDIVELLLPTSAERGAIYTPLRLRSPGYGSPDSISVSVTTDGLVVENRRRSREHIGSSYVAREVWPTMRFDGAADVGWYDPDDVLLVLPIWGQSKAFGQNTDGDAIISASATYPGRAVMPSFGCHIAGRRFSGVADLVESTYSSARETSASALANHYIKWTYDAVGVEPHVLTFIAAESAQPYSNLKRGSASGVDLVNGLIDAQAYAASIGKVAICPAIFTNHGQNATDERGGVGSYIAAMQQFRAWFHGAARSILGQADDPQVIMSQVDAGLQRDLGASNFFTGSTSRAQAMLRDMPGFAVAGNEGWMPVGSDDLHCTSEGYYLQGMMWARALYRAVGLTGASAISVTNVIARSSTVFDLEFEVPERADLSLVSGGIVAAPTAGVETIAGLQFAGAGGLIAASGYSLSVIDPLATGPAVSNVNRRWLRVTFVSPPAGILRWSIAMRSDADGMGRSSLGSSATFSSIHTLPSGQPYRDYAIAQSGEFPALT